MAKEKTAIALELISFRKKTIDPMTGRSYTQQGFADKISEPRASYARYELYTIPNKSVADKIKKVFGIDITKVDQLDKKSSTIFTIDTGTVMERIIRNEAALNTILLTVAELSSRVSGKSIASVRTDLQKEIDYQSDRLFAELSRKGK